MASARRSRLQIYVDVLQSMRATAGAGISMSMYQVERLSGLTYKRLQEYRQELRSLGLLDGSEGVGERGREFLQDMSRTVVPVLLKYGLWEPTLTNRLVDALIES
jgi:predicted transcriptional regulator